jgi:hypothetical protein
VDPQCHAFNEPGTRRVIANGVTQTVDQNLESRRQGSRAAFER